MIGKHTVLLAIALLTIAGSPTQGNTFTVDSTGDAGDPVLGDDICGTIQVDRRDPSSGPCTLRAAIQTANANSTTDTIQFNIPAADSNCVNGVCTINLTQVLPDLSTNMSITGPGADLLKVRPVAGGEFRIFSVAAASAVTFSGLTIANGFSPNTAGGGIVNRGTLTITNSTISGNSVTGHGGGIANGGTLTVTNSTISGNTASGGTLGNQGGGIYNTSFGIVNITNSILLRNRAIASGTNSANGGGIFTNGTVNVTNCTFISNSSEAPEGNASGGGISNENGLVNVANSALDGNICGPIAGLNFAVDARGGGIFSQGGTTNVTNSTLSNNQAFALGPRSARGGGIFINTGTVNVTNSTLIRNASSPSSSATSPMTLFGGGVFNATGTVNVKSTIIALNRVTAQGGAEGSNPDVSGPFTSHGFNLIGKRDGSAGFTQPTDQTGTLASPLDPKLDLDPRDNGGPTSTIALLPGSPAIDKGTSHCLTCGSTGVLGTDQRDTGFPRTFDDPATPNATGGDGTDIGAFEAQISLVTRLANISTRLPVQTGDNVLIGGFIITGTQPKKVILRAIGPSLPFPNKLADPTLELFGPSGPIESNDNWVESTNKQAIIDSTIPPSNDLESAIVATLPANNAGYTAIVRGINNGTGIGIVEAYDLDPTVDSKLANISTRGFVQTGDSVLIAGTIVAGQIPQRVMIRAIGPSLSIAGRMEDPTLELRNSNGVLLRANDNWVESGDKQAIIDTTIPPTNDLESAIITTLPTNNASYTAIVRGVNNSTGIALVEVYALN